MVVRDSAWHRDLRRAIEATRLDVVPSTIELTITESDDKVASKSTLTVTPGSRLEFDVDLELGSSEKK